DITNIKAKSKDVQCLDLAQETYPFIISRLYVEEERKKLDVKIPILKEHVKNVLNAARSMFDASDWLSSEAKANLIDKIDKMNVVYGYPHWIMNDTLLDKFYDTEKVDHGLFTSYFDNVKSLLRWDFSDLTLFNKKERLLSFVLASNPLEAVNAYYLF